MRIKKVKIIIHHGFKKGKKVFIILRNGEKIIDKFKDSNSQYIELEKHKIFWKDIQATTINKNRRLKNDI